MPLLIHCVRSFAEYTFEENGSNLIQPDQLILKVLIPGYAAGAVIGKGGQIIVQLQKESGAVIKLSKAKDFYPGLFHSFIICSLLYTKE